MIEARFWSAVLGDPVTYADEDFVVVSANATTSGVAFQRAPRLPAPTWPEPGMPQQMHLDVMVDDLEAAGTAVLALGGRALGGDHVYADPAGHPFCLIKRPGWAPPVQGGPGQADAAKGQPDAGEGDGSD